MPKLIFDIETIGEEFDMMDATTQHVLTNWISQNSKSEEEYEKALKDLKNGLGFSPLTGEIVAIGMLDGDTDHGAVYFQAPDAGLTEFTEDNIKYRPMSEKEILQQFWEVSKKYDHFVTFNGRCFDVPFIIARSAIHGIKPSKDLMANRYLNSQKFDAKHIDLYDQLSFYGATRTKGSLHLWCRAFGIKSPKADGVTGDDVTALFREKKFLDIARYNVRDIYATKELLYKWEKYMKIE